MAIDFGNKEWPADLYKHLESFGKTGKWHRRRGYETASIKYCLVLKGKMGRCMAESGLRKLVKMFLIIKATHKY